MTASSPSGTDAGRAADRGRPWVTLKLALSLDGRVAAPDGSSRWITSPDARADAHRLRGEHDAIAVGTGTALRDDPALTVRPPTNGVAPLRVVLGHRTLPRSAQLLDTSNAPTLRLATHSATEALARLHERHVRSVLLEGGPTVASAWLRAGVVDDLIVYVAPVVLGDGPSALAPFGVDTIAQAWRGRVTDVTRIGADVRLRITPPEPPASPAFPASPERIN